MPPSRRPAPDLAQFRTLQARFQDCGPRRTGQRSAVRGGHVRPTRRWRPTARASSPRSKPCSGRARASLRRWPRGQRPPDRRGRGQLLVDDGLAGQPEEQRQQQRHDEQSHEDLLEPVHRLGHAGRAAQLDRRHDPSGDHDQPRRQQRRPPPHPTHPRILARVHARNRKGRARGGARPFRWWSGGGELPRLRLHLGQRHHLLAAAVHVVGDDAVRQPPGLVGVWLGQAPPRAHCALIACLGGHSGGHSTGHN
jgi:hypothetical protein